MNFFYRGNKLLSGLKGSSSFWVPPEGTWSLIYADDEFRARLLLNAFEDSSKYQEYWKNLLRFRSTVSASLLINSPYEFAFKLDNQEEVQVFSHTELIEKYKSLGLILDTDYHGKPINSRYSSPYHQWQSRQRFIGGITDIDLVRIDIEREPIEIIEIKRSRIPINAWKPYFNDNGGYKILEQFCFAEDLEFTIVYYHYDPRNQIENTEELLILKKVGDFKFLELGIFKLEEFIAKKY
jgi:hypothetical protein